MKYLWVILLCSLNFTVVSATDCNDIFRFAGHLFDRGDYYRSITEYRRFIFLCPEDQRVVDCRLSIGEAYLAGKRFSRAETEFREILHRYPDTKTALLARYQLGKTFYFQGRPHEAYQWLHFPETRSLSDSFLFNVQLSKIYCCLQLHEIPCAAQLAEDLPVPESSGFDRQAFSRKLSGLSNLRYRHPKLAGILSAILPGSGQLYAGRPRDGLMAFLVNTVFLSGMAISFERNHTGSAIVLSFFELGWYSANIYNAINDCHKSNRDAWENHLKMLEREFGTPFSPLE